MSYNFRDLTGKVFGRLTVIKRIEDRIQPSGQKKTQWLCKCECGNYSKVTSSNLLKKHSVSCGCFAKESTKKRATVHGFSKKERLYNIWTGIRKRCFTKTCPDYKNYGGRGITLCEKWLDYINFRNWALNNGYSEQLTIERKNLNDNYCPENCLWIEKKEQSKNRRNVIKINGKTLPDICKELSPNNKKLYQKIYMRLKRGMPVEKALYPKNYK